jgi:hypothetical protein
MSLFAWRKDMKPGMILSVVCIVVLFCGTGFAQQPLHPSDFHAGLHSGSWTLRREQLLELESKDKYRNCTDPHCARCAKHLADYGHEYQYLGGPNQRQPWYRGTAGNVAVVTQRGYDQHGIPYARRGQPAAVMSWEYRQTLNHAIWEQLQARNAVAAEEAAIDRIPLLTKLLDDAREQFRLTKEAFEEYEKNGGHCIALDKIDEKNISEVVSPCAKALKEYPTEIKAGRGVVAQQGLCEYCLAKARFCFDRDYVSAVEQELAFAQQDLAYKSAIAAEAVRVALLSKEDAEKATRFKRIQNKPPKYKEVLAAQEAVQATIDEIKDPTKTLETEK